MSACNGDSGGPLQCQVKGHNHNYDLSQVRNVFTRVSYYYDWIESQIQYNIKTYYKLLII